jgi:hypothetical protein
MAGAPKGNQNARKAKDWEIALRRAIANYEDKAEGVARGDALQHAARKVVKAAVAGDWDAIDHIANRLDGKPTEHVQNEHRHTFASELSDAELVAIATGSSEGASEAQGSPEEPAPVH